MTRIAIVQFPGTNCENETREAVMAAGGHGDIVRWNAPREVWSTYDGYVLPGGFSYEDRVRAGAVAAKHALLDEIAAAVDAGKPVLGLCNGAQILVEAGLLPGLHPGAVEVALAPNAADEWSNYYCGWVHLQTVRGPGMASELAATASLLPMPVGHGEGRFTGDPQLFAELERRGQIALRYVAPDGGPARGFPHNPNGALCDAAGLCDVHGRVLALMPHPERGAWLHQVPEELPGPWGEARRSAAGDRRALVGRGPGLGVYEVFVRAARAAAVSPGGR
jgi:phosphoribosylformylglycinamidine synthase